MRRPTFEPSDSSPAPLIDELQPIADNNAANMAVAATTTINTISNNNMESAAAVAGTATAAVVQGSGAGGGIAGVAGVAPEVSRANAVFCLGRRRRRLGANLRPGRGLGVGVGTAAAEVALGARRRARLHATNPCFGTPMEQFVWWSIANGQDPFYGEGRGGGGVRTGSEGVGGRGREGGEDEWEEKENGREDTGNIWLDYYVRVFNSR